MKLPSLLAGCWGIVRPQVRDDLFRRILRNGSPVCIDHLVKHALPGSGWERGVHSDVRGAVTESAKYLDNLTALALRKFWSIKGICPHTIHSISRLLDWVRLSSTVQRTLTVLSTAKQTGNLAFGENSPTQYNQNKSYYNASHLFHSKHPFNNP